MKKTVLFLMLILSISYLVSCTSRIQHADSFYNYTDDGWSARHIPLIEPLEATGLPPKYPWGIFIDYGLWVSIPNEQGLVFYPYGIEELEKFAVKNDVIMAYSAYVDVEADPFIRDNYYHWFVLIPDQEIAEGFHTEAEFLEYLQTLGIQDPDWQTPDEAYKQYKRTGCLAWFPDCDGSE